MLIGYLPHGVEETFLEELEKAGCQRIVVERGAHGHAALWELLPHLNEGDILVLNEAGHAGSQAHFVKILIELGIKRAHLVSLAEGIDTLRDSTVFSTQAVS